VHNGRGVETRIDRGDLYVWTGFGAQHVRKSVGGVFRRHIGRPGLMAMNKSGNTGQVDDTTITVHLAAENGQKSLAAPDQAQVVDLGVWIGSVFV
jgi:hypothetical protein